MFTTSIVGPKYRDHLNFMIEIEIENFQLSAWQYFYQLKSCKTFVKVKIVLEG